MEIQEMDVVMTRRDNVADFCFTLTKLNSRKVKHLRSSLIVSKRWTLAVQ